VTSMLTSAVLGLVGAALGGSLPWWFDRLPDEWLTEYGERPTKEVVERPRIERRWAAPLAAALAVVGYVGGMQMPASEAFFALVGAAILFAVIASDLLYTIVPDQAVLALIGVGAAAAVFRGWSADAVLPTLGSALVGGLVGAMVLAAVAFIGSRVAGREAMGMGDVKLAAAMGVVLGFPQIVTALVIAVLVAGVWFGVLMFTRRLERGDAAPFGPFLASATLITILASDPIRTFVDWYVSLLGGGS